MEFLDYHLDEESKKPLKWAHKSSRTKLQEPDGEDDLSNLDFCDLKSGLRRELKELKNDREKSVDRINNELSKMAKQLGPNVSHMFDQSFARLAAGLEISESDVNQLLIGLKVVSNLAENISNRVAVLDQGRNHVVECLQRVSDLRDIKTCSEGVEKAIAQEEFEEAAKHIYRFLTLDSFIFKMGDQIDSKDTGHSLKNSYEILRESSLKLKSIIETKFEEARAKNNVAEMERFLKLFPLINEHQNGIKRLGKYLCTRIESIGNENYKIMDAGGTDDKRKDILYADTLALIFEGIAQLIELYLPLVENFYGSRNLILLLETIQEECDRQTSRIINAFVQRRHFEAKVLQISNYLRNISMDSAVLGFHKSASTGDVNKNKIEPLELDVLLYEVTLMHTHAESYWRFLKRRVAKSVDAKPQTGGDHFEPNQIFDTDEKRNAELEEIRKQNEEREKKLDCLLNRTVLNLKMQELLGKYVLLEQYYMTESVKKAIEIDTVEEGSMTSSILDDVFFIVRKSIRRSISSSSVDCVCATLNNGISLLETDFIKYLNLPIKTGYSSWTMDAYQTAYNVISNPHSRAGSSEINSEKQASFITAINNLRTSIKCANTLKNGLKEDFTKHLSQESIVEKNKIENSIGQFDEFSKRLEHHANIGIGKLYEVAIRPKIRSSIEAIQNISHVIGEEELVEFESSDPFIEGFISFVDKTISNFEKVFIQENYQILLNTLCQDAANIFEQTIFKCSFNRLGALQLDKEFRQLISYLTNVSGWSIREKCAKLSQTVAMLNTESVQESVQLVQQFRSGAITTVHFSANDVRRTLSLRVDYSRETIKSIKL